MKTILTFAPLLTGLAAAASAAPAPITGNWLTEDGKGLIEIASCGSQLCGKLVRVVKPTPGRPTTDINNPDAKLRQRQLVGTYILTGFTADSDRWRGRIYDPESGKTYRSEVSRDGAGLKVKGCISFFCRTQNWSRG